MSNQSLFQQAPKTQDGKKFKIFVDASALKQSTCPRKFAWTLLGYRSARVPYKMLYGTAIHKALQYIYTRIFECSDNLTDDDKFKALGNEAADVAVKFFEPFASEVPEGDYYGIFHLNSVIMNYLDNIRCEQAITILQSNGKPLVEQKFEIPAHKLGLVSENNTYEITLTGTIDLPCLYFGDPTVVDHKTSGTKNPEAKLREYEIDIQMMFYSYIWARLARVNYPKVVVNGIFLKGQTARSPNPAIFARSNIITFSDERMEEFQTWLINKLAILTYALQQDDVLSIMQTKPEYVMCNRGYPACEFLKVCTENYEAHDAMLQAHYTQKMYNPLDFQE